MSLVGPATHPCRKTLTLYPSVILDLLVSTPFSRTQARRESASLPSLRSVSTWSMPMYQSAPSSTYGSIHEWGITTSMWVMRILTIHQRWMFCGRFGGYGSDDSLSFSDCEEDEGSSSASNTKRLDAYIKQMSAPREFDGMMVMLGMMPLF